MDIITQSVFNQTPTKGFYRRCNSQIEHEVSFKINNWCERKSNGPRIEPWRAPKLMRFGEGWELSNWKLCCRFAKEVSGESKRNVIMPRRINFVLVYCDLSNRTLAQNQFTVRLLMKHNLYILYCVYRAGNFSYGRKYRSLKLNWWRKALSQVFFLLGQSIISFFLDLA